MATKRTAAAKKTEQVEVIEEVKKPKAVKKPAEPFFVQNGQTEVSSRRQLINFFPNTKRVVVENLGGGDLYVGTTNIDFIAENLVRIGETKEITDVNAFYVGALSRPFFRISHFE